MPRLRTPARRSALLATICGLLVPGGGQLYVGRPGKALTMFAGIGFLYLVGLHLTGYTAVNPHTHKLEFVAHAMALGPTALVTYLTQHVTLTEPKPWLEIGRLYVAIAGLLNLVAISDAWGHVLHHNQRADRVRDRLARRGRTAAAGTIDAGAEATLADTLTSSVPVGAWEPALPGEPGFVPGVEADDDPDPGEDDGWNLFDKLEQSAQPEAPSESAPDTARRPEAPDGSH